MLLLLISCAQQVRPSGGAKDTTPPKILKSIPQNNSVNFKGSKIEIKLDEYFNLVNPTENIIISPRVATEPDYKITGKTLEINFTTPLSENTTYILNLGEAVKDIHEGNVLDSNVFVFSTGNYIDSLTVSGTIKDAETLLIPEKTKIFLYQKFQDSIPYLSKPDYYTEVDENGFFEVKNLKAGKYKIIALKEEMTNFLYDSPTEQIGFLKTTITLPTTDTLKMYLFIEKHPNQYVKSVKSEYGKIQILFNEPIDEKQKVTLNLIGKTFKRPWYIEDLGVNRDTLTLWYSGMGTSEKEELHIVLDTLINDTVEFKIPEADKNLKNTTFEYNISKNRTINPYKNLVINANRPIVSVNNKAVFLIENKDTLDVNVIQKKDTPKQMEIQHKWKPKSNYQLLLLPDAVTDVFLKNIDTTSTSFKIEEALNYVDFTLKIKTQKAGKYILYLLNEHGVAISEKVLMGNSSMKYNALKTGKYRLKLAYDANKNNRWDTGNYLKYQQAEKIIYYPELIEIRSGWEVNIEWKIDGNNKSKP